MVIPGPSSAFESETFGQDASFHLEQPIGAMSISPSGRDVVLASKEGLHIIDLDSPYSPPRYLPHRTPWEVADVQWSPFAKRDFWVVSTSNQKALVWNLEAKSWQESIEIVLHGHTRAITDVNFSAFNPDILATCAVDSFVHCWDLRTPLRPAFSFSDWFAGATQVKWSRQDEHVVASAHDRFLHIWDDRNGARPLRTITAHGTKIYGVDWNRFEVSKLVTCSLDKTIKFWDLNNSEDVPERVIETPFPVWRARHTPFGWGLLAMPQRGSHDLYLYDRRPVDGVYKSGHVPPVATFSGHEGQVKEFLWRARGTLVDGVDHRDFQLVSWGTDRELRLHRIEADTFSGIDYIKGVTRPPRLQFTRRDARYRTFRDDPDESNSPIDSHSRGDSIPSASQFLHLRQRTSMNIGMNKVPVSRFRGWVEGSRHVNRTGMHGKSNIQNNIDPVSWLKHVKIPSWDSDTIAEEIRHVGEKFKRVDFEVVDIQRRKSVMSLQAPWGDQQAPLYIRVEMRFPKTYPRYSNAIISLQKSSVIADELHKILSTEIQTISETYASRQRGCIEAIIRYLLREQSMEQIVAWILGESLIESKIIDPQAVPAEESSSDDDEPLEGLGNVIDSSANARVPLAKGCGALWAENGKLICFFPPSQKESNSFFSNLEARNLEESQSNKLFEGFGRLRASSPARRATNGTRTIVEESDSDTSDSLLGSSSSSSASSEPETNLHGSLLPFQAGMPILQQRSRSLDRSNYSTTLGGQKVATDQRITFISIHNLEDLLPSKRNLASQYRIEGPREEVCRVNADIASRASREDLALIWTLAGLILDQNVPRLTPSPLKHVNKPDIMAIARQSISNLKSKGHQWHDTFDSEQFPQNYSLKSTSKWGNSPFGSGYLVPAMFDHFERTADLQMLAMLSYIFADSTQVVSSHLSKAYIVSSDYQKVSTPLRNGDSASSYAIESPAKFAEPAGPRARSRSSASHSPSTNLFGSDLQQLSRQQKPATLLSKTTSASANRHLERSLSFRTSNAAADETGDRSSLASAAVSVSTSPENNRLSQRNYQSAAYSSARASLSALTQSYSDSPPTHSSGSGMASSLKKYSPSGSLTPAWVSTGIFSSNTSGRNSRASLHQLEPGSDEQESILRTSASFTSFRGTNKEGQMTPEITIRGIGSRPPSEFSVSTRRRKLPGKRKISKTSLHNRQDFDLDEYAPGSLLDSRLAWKYKAYRSSYAQLLEVWQLHVQKAEMLKFDTVQANFPRSTRGSISVTRNLETEQTWTSRRLRKHSTSKQEALENPFQIRRCCRNCGNALDAIERNGIPIGWHCVNSRCTPGSKTFPKRSVCAICCEAIAGLSVPCLQCGHLTCYDCAEGWFGPDSRNNLPIRRSSSSESRLGTMDTDDQDDYERILEKEVNSPRSCPTGCGCLCPTSTAALIPDSIKPQTEQDTGILLSPTVPIKPSGSAVSRSARLMSESGPDTALGAFLALTRTRSKAGKEASGLAVAEALHTTVDEDDSEVQQDADAESHAHGGNSNRSLHSARATSFSSSTATSDEDVMNPWAGSKIASLGRGIGSGLSRGLKTKASDSTIRRISAK